MRPLNNPSSLGRRPLPPAGKVASAVDEGKREHGVGGDLIEQPISQHEKLADRRIPKLGYHAHALADQYVGLEAIGDGLWNIVYFRTLLGRIDERTGIITGV